MKSHQLNVVRAQLLLVILTFLYHYLYQWSKMRRWCRVCYSQCSAFRGTFGQLNKIVRITVSHRLL